MDKLIGTNTSCYVGCSSAGMCLEPLDQCYLIPSKLPWLARCSTYDSFYVIPSTVVHSVRGGTTSFYYHQSLISLYYLLSYSVDVCIEADSL